MSYTSEEKIEDFLKRNLTSEEQALLNSVLEVVDSYIDFEVGHFGAVSATTKQYHGGVRDLDIDYATEVTAVEVLDNYGDLYDTYLATQYIVSPVNEDTKTYIHKRLGIFPSGFANIRVTGKFTRANTVPTDIEYLATYLAGQMFSSAIVDNIKSESIEGYSRTFNSLIEENQTIKMIVEKYKSNDIMIC